MDFKNITPLRINKISIKSNQRLNHFTHYVISITNKKHIGLKLMVPFYFIFFNIIKLKNYN